MTSTLLQKHPIKGSREFRIVDDEIQYTIQSPFKTESLTVIFATLDAEPVTTGSILAFRSKVNKEPLVELLLNKPDKQTFDHFVKIIQEKIIENDIGRFRVGDKGIEVDLERLDESIHMLQTYVDPTEIERLLSALIELKENPKDINKQKAVADEFNQLGFAQSKVITYAPYVNFMFSGYKYTT